MREFVKKGKGKEKHDIKCVMDAKGGGDKVAIKPYTQKGKSIFLEPLPLVRFLSSEATL